MRRSAARNRCRHVDPASRHVRQLRVLRLFTPRVAHDHVDIELDSGQTLRFNYLCCFGSLLFTTGDASGHPLLKSLLELLEDEFNGEYLWKITRRRSVAIKQSIMKSRLVVGVGNIYASVSFRAPRGRLPPGTQTQPGRVHEAGARHQGQDAPAMAVKVGGTTLRDDVGADGNPGYFRQKLYVYERAGEPCRVCGKPVEQFTQGGRSTYWCSNCQK